MNADTNVDRIGREARELDALKLRLVNLVKFERANSSIEATALAVDSPEFADLASLEYRALLLPLGEGLL